MWAMLAGGLFQRTLDMSRSKRIRQFFVSSRTRQAHQPCWQMFQRYKCILLGQAPTFLDFRRMWDKLACVCFFVFGGAVRHSLMAVGEFFSWFTR